MRARSLSQASKYPVTAALGVAAIGVTAFALTSRPATTIYGTLGMSHAAFWREPWRLVTSTLPHVDLLHLAFNAYWLWLLGTTLEEGLGHLRYLGLVLVLAVGSSAAEFALFEGGVGLTSSTQTPLPRRGTGYVSSQSQVL